MKIFEAIKRLCDGKDNGDIVFFVVMLCLFPPVTLIWLVVRIIQEMDELE